MMRTILTNTAFTVCLSAFCVSTASAQSTLNGFWRNTDKNTRGVTKLLVTGSGNNYTIRAWGKCHPSDCYWGSRKLHVLGTSVSSKTKRYGFAVYNQKFAVKYMSLRRVGNYLIAEINTIFLDNSGRSNYRSTYTFRRNLRTLPVGTIKR
ncbi:MAG: hypothetical protein ACFCD0_08615 [Gemmataceae bacterium]